MQATPQRRFFSPAGLVLLFWLLNAALYPLLLPLWDGFDEPFHYAYAQHLATEGRWPVLGHTPLSKEIDRSLHLAPASHIVRHNLPFVMTFGEFHALPVPERQARRESLETIDPGWRTLPQPGTLNYEAQQPPLAYLLPAAVDSMAARLPLVRRVLLARLAVSLAGGALQLWLTLQLASELGLSVAWQPFVLFLVTSSQMFYATVSRVSNDWLAVPLGTLFFLAMLRFHRQPGVRHAVILGLAVAAGLLTKAYFLPWALLAAALVVWSWWRHLAHARAALAAAAAMALALPWYLRNAALYGSFSGMQQSAAGTGAADTVRAALSIPWPEVTWAAFRGAVWTGNNSFTSFSSTTVDIFLLLWLLAGGCWLLTCRRGSLPFAERLVAAGLAVFFAALLYANALFVAHGSATYHVATPWYAQPLAAPCACVACLGMSRVWRAGRWLAPALAALSAYLICATYFLKLIPLYAGFTARVSPASLLRWWSNDPAGCFATLRDTVAGDVSVVAVLACAVAIAAPAAAVAVCRAAVLSLLREGPHAPDSLSSPSLPGRLRPAGPL
ncbi:MAG: hypothetical protein HY821_03410 [Acidobacteria bacterium]|nr:hypothetical protein [Acidobacteriota bacterium]